MNSASRLLLILAGASAWAFALARPDLEALFDLKSDLWNLPALLEKCEDLESQSAQCDQHIADMRRLYEGRREVVIGLLERRLDLSEAVARFGALAALRKESGLGHLDEQKPGALVGPASQLLNWIRAERREKKQKRDRDVLEQVEAELQCLVESGH